MSEKNPTASGKPFVSVIIPHFNQQNSLKACLCALRRQDYPGDRCEIIVSDNDSPEGLDEIKTLFPDITFVAEATPGSYAARNAAIHSCRGEIAAFTDADCIPAADWLSGAVAHFDREGSDLAVAGGRIAQCDISSTGAVALHQKTYAFNQEEKVANHHFAATANLFVRTDLFSKIGTFKQQLMSGGDVEFCQRAWAQGYHVKYLHEAVVHHPARSGWNEVVTKTRRVEGGRFIGNRMGMYRVARPNPSLWDVLFPRKKFLRTMHNRHIPGLRRKLQVFLVQALLGIVGWLEIKRLQLGGRPERV